MPQLNKQDLESLLRPRLGKDLVVESFTSTALTQPGENYGSIMLAIEVNIRQEGHKATSRNLSLVAKLVAYTDFQWKEFYPPNTFCKEINCYTLVKEEYSKLQIEKNVPKDKFCDVFPECYGARTSLSGEIGDKADRDAALLLENLKTKNYRLGDRREGLDLKHSEMAISHLARFHALSIAMEELKPQEFKDKILKACKPHFIGFNWEEMENGLTTLLKNIKNIPGCEMHIDKLRKAGETNLRMHLNKAYEKPNKPYAALCHSDFWINNMMFCYESNNDNTPIDMKFLDYQIVRYTSPVKDLLFFLYTSTADGVRAGHYDDLIRLYYEHFIDFLVSLDCDTSPFSFKSFLDEIEEFAPTEAYHILFMMVAICANKSNVPDMENFSHDAIFRNSDDVFQRREREFILDFVRRGWL